MATIGRSNGAAFNNTSRLSYIATAAFDTYFFSYSTSINASLETVGTLATVVGATPVTCPKGRVLRENGRKLYPGANPGVTTYLVGVYDAQSMLNGFIDPNAKVFQIYNTDKPNFLADGVSGTTDLGPSVYTRGDITAQGALTISGAGDIKGGLTVTGGETIQTGDLTVTLGKVYARGGVGTQLGQTVTQTGSRTSTVTSNTPSGRIELVSVAMTNSQILKFTLNNTYIDVGDYVAVQPVAVAGTVGSSSCGIYYVSAAVTANDTAEITIRNINDGNTANETVTIQYMVFKGVY